MKISSNHIFALVARNEGPASESRKPRPCITENKILLCSLTSWGPGFPHSHWSKALKQWYVEMGNVWCPKIWDYTAREGADLGVRLPPPRLMATICLHTHSKWQLRSKWAFPPGWLWGGKSSKPCSCHASFRAQIKRSLWRISSIAPWRSKSTSMYTSFSAPTGPRVGWDQSCPELPHGTGPCKVQAATPGCTWAAQEEVQGPPSLHGEVCRGDRVGSFWEWRVWELAQTSALTTVSPYPSFTAERSQPTWRSKCWRRPIHHHLDPSITIK